MRRRCPPTGKPILARLVEPSLEILGDEVKRAVASAEDLGVVEGRPGPETRLQQIGVRDLNREPSMPERDVGLDLSVVTALVRQGQRS